MNTITGTEGTVEILYSLVLNSSKFLLKRTKHGYIDVVNKDGETIGSARLYSNGQGYAIHTKNYGGFAGHDEVHFIN